MPPKSKKTSLEAGLEESKVLLAESQDPALKLENG